MTIVQKEKTPNKKSGKTHERIVKLIKRKRKLKELKKAVKNNQPKPKEQSKPAKVSDAPLSAEESALKLMGLPFAATQTQVKNWFKDDGLHVEQVYMVGKERKTGMAYVTMKTDVSLKKGLKKDKKYMGERYVNVLLKTKKEMNDVLGLATMMDNSVFLRGLPFEVYSLDILRFFQGLKIAENGIHLKNKGFGIVEFVDSDTAKEALKRDKSYIRERWVKVFPCRMKDLVEMRDQIMETKKRKIKSKKEDQNKEITSMETGEGATEENEEGASSNEEAEKEEEKAEAAMEVESPKESDSEKEEEEKKDVKQAEEAESESEDEMKENGEGDSGSDEQQAESNAEEELEEEPKEKKPKGKKKTVVDVVMDKFSPRRLRSRSGTPSKAQTPQVKRLATPKAAATPRTPKAAATPRTPKAVATPRTPKAVATPRTPRASARRGKKE